LAARLHSARPTRRAYPGEEFASNNPIRSPQPTNRLRTSFCAGWTGPGCLTSPDGAIRSQVAHMRALSRIMLSRASAFHRLPSLNQPQPKHLVTGFPSGSGEATAFFDPLLEQIGTCHPGLLDDARSPLGSGYVAVHSGASLKAVGNDFDNGTKRLDGSDYRRDEAAAVNAMASGSQHSTISAISHRIARSLSASAPINSAT